MRKKRAFTLSEILIALSIVGFISVMAISAVSSHRPNKDMLMYRKSFNNLQNVVNILVSKEDIYPLQRLKLASMPINGKNLCENIVEYMNTIGEVDCNGEKGSFITSDGVQWSEINSNALITEEPTDDTITTIVLTINDTPYNIRLKWNGQVMIPDSNDKNYDLIKNWIESPENIFENQ